MLKGWKNPICLLLNVHGIKDVTQTDTHTSEPLVPQPTDPLIEIAIEISENIQAPGTGQIPGEVMTVSSKTHILILFVARKNCLSSGKSIIVPIRMRKVTYYHTVHNL